MASRRELAEAQGFERRRLVAAFAEPGPSPARTLLTGLAVTALLAGALWLPRLLTGRPPDDWLEPGLLIVRDRGATYLVSGDPAVLHPASYLTAQLLLGSDPPTRTVRAEDVAGQPIGSALGIPGAPSMLPSAEHAYRGPWTACTAPGRGLDLSVGEPEHPVAGPILVTSAGTRWLIRNGVSGAVRAPTTARGPALRVPPAWLALIDRGRVHPAASSRSAGTPCVSLGADGRVRLGSSPHPIAAAAGMRTVRMPRGSVIYLRVRGDPWTYLVGPDAVAHRLVGPEVAGRLGFARETPRVLPRAWLELFGAGVDLSVEAAAAGTG